ncbi:MAG: FG-GAP repeat protein [Nocardioides sp.]|nr:FG-GAP repeat protein [Nocardioides sp.]
MTSTRCLLRWTRPRSRHSQTCSASSCSHRATNSTDCGSDWTRPGCQFSATRVVGAPPVTAGQGFQIIGAVTNDEAGTSVAGAGDINSDGKDDLVVGAPWSDYGGRTDAGSVYVVWGKPPAPPSTSPTSTTNRAGATGSPGRPPRRTATPRSRRPVALRAATAARCMAARIGG